MLRTDQETARTGNDIPGRRADIVALATDATIHIAEIREVGTFGFWSMMIFLSVLTVGFIYEWRKGALEWD